MFSSFMWENVIYGSSTAFNWLNFKDRSRFSSSSDSDEDYLFSSDEEELYE